MQLFSYDQKSYQHVDFRMHITPDSDQCMTFSLHWLNLTWKDLKGLADLSQSTGNIYIYNIF